MKIKKPLFKSLFSLLEENNESHSAFVWSRYKVPSCPEPTLYEGELLIIKQNSSRICHRRYILTLNSLVQYKVSISFIIEICF